MFSNQISTLKESAHPQILMVRMLNEDIDPSQKMDLLAEILFDMNFFRVLIATRVNLVYFIRNLAEPYLEKICDQLVSDPNHYALIMSKNIDLKLTSDALSKKKLPDHTHFFYYKDRDTAVEMIKARYDAVKKCLELTESIIPCLITIHQSTSPSHLKKLPGDIFKLLLQYLFDHKWIAPTKITESINQAYQSAKSTKM